MKIYTTSESSSKLDVTIRTIQNYCKTWNVEKIKGRYQITDELLNEWQKLQEEPADEIDLLKEEIDNLKAIIEGLRGQLEQYQVNDNERIEVFTEDEYRLFEQRLIEWQEQRRKINEQERIFNIEKASLKEISDHYKEQFEYQKQQNDKMLNVHQRLLDTLNSQTKIITQRNFIEAKEKGLDE